jgi:hypothetical protein
VGLVQAIVVLRQHRTTFGSPLPRFPAHAKCKFNLLFWQQPRPQKPPAKGTTAGFAREPRVFAAHHPPTIHAVRLPTSLQANHRRDAVCCGGTTTCNRCLAPTSSQANYRRLPTHTPPRASHRPGGALRANTTPSVTHNSTPMPASHRLGAVFRLRQPNSDNNDSFKQARVGKV